jgi:ABC-2 type transport system ATP-binding protein
LIEIKGLIKEFGKVRAVDDLNLTVERGEFFGFLGPNGAGKTTTIKIMAGLLKPTSGKVRLGGYDLKREMFKAKGISSYIPDKPFIYEKLTGREFLRFVSGLYGMGENDVEGKIDELAVTFSMTDYIDDMVEGYSHGMKQKLVMAQALIHNPEIIIVDEPMVGLDPRSIKLVKEIFTRLAEKGVTIFMSTHTLEHAQEMCDRIGIIHRGNLIAVGSMDELMKTAHTRRRELEEIFFILTEEEGGTGV